MNFLWSSSYLAFRFRRRPNALRPALTERVRAASRECLPDGYWATGGRVAATLFYFPASAMDGDIDNIIKPVPDALGRNIDMDDGQVERVVAQKFEPAKMFNFSAPSAKLADAVNGQKPVLYVKLSNNPFEELS